MSDSAALERRYRRLLAWFPAEHRRVYGEEMIGVLLASAPDGQDRPAPGEITNLMSSGLRTRLRNWTGIDRVDSRWADALAAFSVAAPILMAGFVSFQLYIAVRFLGIFESFARFPRAARFFRQVHPVHELITWVLLDATAVAAVAALLVCPVLLRRGKRRAVRLITGAAVLLGLVATVNVDAGGFGEFQVGFTAFFLLELAAVAISPGPGRGWRALTGKGVIMVAAIAGVAVAAETLLQGPVLQSLRVNGNVVILAALAAGIALIMIFGSDAHKRLLALLAIPAYPLLANSYVYGSLFSHDRHHLVGQVLYLPTLAIAALVGLAIWQASRTRHAAGQPQAGVAG
jgi:hypothetical protein